VHRDYIYIQKDKKTDGDIKVTYTHAMEDKRQETMDGGTKNNAVGRETEDADRNHSLEDERPRINDERQRMEDMLQNIEEG